ncbi:MAG: DUF72 domain-containing protein [Thermofilum sp.]|nr:DUF72 domain-containing protein [Thermofilum sp.]
MGLLYPRVFIGTSGWDYDDWLDVFYESERGMFSFYTRFFNTVEINSSFYTILSERFYRGLAEASPRDFLFSVKMYRGVTHKKVLNPKLLGGELEVFFKSIRPLEELKKLGAVLIQMPPVPMREVPWFDSFLELLPKGPRFAVEFRDHSWLCEEVFRKLREAGIALTIVDEPLLPPLMLKTSDFVYIRWHGRGESPWYYYHYSMEELSGWASRLQEFLSKEDVKLVLGYFNNHFRGFAPHNALQMMTLLGIASRRQREKLQEMENFFKSVPMKVVKSLREVVSKGDVESALIFLAGEKRFERAKEISDESVKYSVEGSALSATVKSYRVEIDLANRRIFHDCEDWKKSAESKRFCKHLVKLFLKLPREVSLGILEDLALNIDEWVFEYPHAQLSS